MTATKSMPLRDLYERDETAWLDAMTVLAATGRYADMDFANLSEYLGAMARRDRREVSSRLITLLVHLLKWDHQPDQRSRSWRGTIFEQRRELRKLLESSTLRNYADSILAEAYADACKQAVVETDLPHETFPVECGWELESLLEESPE